VAKRLNGSRHATWYGGRPRPRRHCVIWGPAPPQEKGHSSAFPTFRPMSVVAKRSPISATAEHLFTVGLKHTDSFHTTDSWFPSELRSRSRTTTDVFSVPGRAVTSHVVVDDVVDEDRPSLATLRQLQQRR